MILPAAPAASLRSARIASLCALALAAALPGVACAQRVWPAPASAPTSTPTSAPTPAPGTAPGTAPQGSGDYLSRMDLDRDGRVSVLEYQDWLSYAFDGMDRDGDGVLSPAEQPGGRGKAVTRAEHRTRLAERFRRQDTDRSGFLDARELAAPPQGR